MTTFTHPTVIPLASLLAFQLPADLANLLQADRLAAGGKI